MAIVVEAPFAIVESLVERKFVLSFPICVTSKSNCPVSISTAHLIVLRLLLLLTTSVYPDAVRCTDDQKMLPIHLASKFLSVF